MERLGEIKFSFPKEVEKEFDKIHESIFEMAQNSEYDDKCKKFLEPYALRWSTYVLKLAMLFRVIEDPLSNKLSSSSLKAAYGIVKVAIKSTAKLFEKELKE